MRPTSTYQPRPRPRDLTLPPRWAPPPRGIEQSPLAQFVLLSMLLHALAIALFGAPTGGSREGRAMWGALTVELQGSYRDAGPRLKFDRGILAPEDVRPEPPPARPKPVEKRFSFPPLLDRITPSDHRLQMTPTLQVPPPTEVVTAPPAPVEPEVVQAPAEVPLPLPVAPTPMRTETVLVETPVLPAVAPMRAAEVPAPLPAAPAQPRQERVLVETPAIPVVASTLPVERPPVEVPALPTPTERIAQPRTELAPIPEVVRGVPVEVPSVRAEPAEAPPQRFRPEAPSVRPEVVEGPAPRRPPSALGEDPTLPTLDPEALRSRAGQLARQGSGQRALLPFPMPAVPARKSKMETAIENARKPDCRTAYQSLGLAAVIPLIANEFGEGSCRW